MRVFRDKGTYSILPLVCIHRGSMYGWPIVFRLRRWHRFERLLWTFLGSGVVSLGHGVIATNGWCQKHKMKATNKNKNYDKNE